MWVRSLGQEDPLETVIASHSRIRSWRIPWTEEPGGLQSMGLQRVGHDLVTKQQKSKTAISHRATFKERNILVHP